jgi:hypothetical protein
MDARDLALVTAVAYATVLAAAGVGKLLDRGSWNLLLGIGEVVLAAAVMLATPWLVVRLVALAVALAYAGHALRLRQQAPCACFGQRLPRTSVAGQRWRNLLLLAVAAILAALGGGIGPLPEVAVVDVALGVCVGVSLVAGPWLAQWLVTAYSVS